MATATAQLTELEGSSFDGQLICPRNPFFEKMQTTTTLPGLSSGVKVFDSVEGASFDGRFICPRNPFWTNTQVIIIPTTTTTTTTMLTTSTIKKPSKNPSPDVLMQYGKIRNMTGDYTPQECDLVCQIDRVIRNLTA